MSRHRCAVAAALLIALAGAAGKLTAAEDASDWLTPGRAWSVAELPQGNTPPAGFTATIDVGADAQVGYVPVRITVSAAGGFPADRELTLRLESTPGGHAPRSRGLLVDFPLRIAEGTRSAIFVRYAPKFSIGNAFDVSLREQGRELTGYRAEVGELMRSPGSIPPPGFQREHPSDFALIGEPGGEGGERLSDVRSFVTASFAQSERMLLPAEPSDEAAWKRVEDSGLLTLWDVAELPEDWRGYQIFDAVIVDAASLQSRGPDAEDRFAPLQDWVRCGGTLIVLGANSPESLNEALPLGEISRWDDQAWQTQRREIEESLSNWRDHFESVADHLRSNSAAPAFGFGGSDADDPELYRQYAERFDAESENLDPDWHRRVWQRSCSAGQVIGIGRGADDQPPSLTHWMLIQRLIGHRVSPMLRRGVEPMLGDTRYRDWLIPGVAQPPVYTFMGLLSVFVILVGPVAYRQTARRGRGYLMFAIAPALALITTLSMFVYGIFADGFGTHARVRQLTWIDGASGDAAERVRSTYFAGIRPGDGLSFPADAEVFPYPYHPGLSWSRLVERDPEILGQAVITDQRQVFSSSFLPSREQRQFVTHRPRRAMGRVTLRTELAKGDASQQAASGQTNPAPRVQSTLEYDLRNVLIRDRQGDYWQLARLPAGAENRPSAPLAPADVSGALGELYNLQRLVAEGVEETSGSGRSRDGVHDILLQLNNELSPARTSTGGLFETWLREHLQLSGELPPGSFIATADVDQESVAVASAELTESIHLVFGTLP